MTAAALDAGLTPLATLMAHVTCGGAYTNRALPTEVRVGERRKELRVVKVFGRLFDKKKAIFRCNCGNSLWYYTCTFGEIVLEDECP